MPSESRSKKNHLFFNILSELLIIGLPVATIGLLLYYYLSPALTEDVKQDISEQLKHFLNQSSPTLDNNSCEKIHKKLPIVPLDKCEKELLPIIRSDENITATSLDQTLGSLTPAIDNRIFYYGFAMFALGVMMTNAIRGCVRGTTCLYNRLYRKSEQPPERLRLNPTLRVIFYGQAPSDTSSDAAERGAVLDRRSQN